MSAASFRDSIKRFNRGLEGLRKVPDQVAALVADVVEEDVRATFAAGQNPYGTAWTPRRTEPKDGHPILDDTGDLKDSLSVRAQGGKLVVTYSDRKAGFHNSGTPTLPVRRLVPDSRGLPKRWRDAIDRAFKRTVRELFK